MFSIVLCMSSCKKNPPTMTYNGLYRGSLTWHIMLIRLYGFGLYRGSLTPMYTLPCQYYLHWLDHVHRIAVGLFPRTYLLYAKQASGCHCVGHSQLCCRDVYKRNIMGWNIDTEYWKVTAENKTLQKHQVSQSLKQGEFARCDAAEEKSAKRKVSHQNEKHYFRRITGCV